MKLLEERAAIEIAEEPAAPAANMDLPKLTLSSTTAFVGQRALLSFRQIEGQPFRVLITDDILMNRKVLGAMCKRMHVAFDYAQDGRACVEKCKETAYDLVLMDVQMPECDGIQATRELKALSSAGLLAGLHVDILIIGCSANSQDADIQACFKAGMDDFIAKPVRFPVLESVVSSNLKKVETRIASSLQGPQRSL